MYIEGMWFSESRTSSSKKGTCRCKNSASGGLHRGASAATAESARKAWSGCSAELTNIHRAKAHDLEHSRSFCWLWSYSKWRQIILPSCQENLKAFKLLCPKRYLKSAKVGHRTKGPQNTFELLGSIKLSICAEFWCI